MKYLNIGEKGEHLDHRPSCPLQGQLQQRRGIDAHLLGAYRPAVGMLSEKKTSNVNNRPRKKKYVRCGHIEPNHRKTKNYGKPFKKHVPLSFGAPIPKASRDCFHSTFRAGVVVYAAAAVQAELALDAMAELCLGPVGHGIFMHR